MQSLFMRRLSAHVIFTCIGFGQGALRPAEVPQNECTDALADLPALADAYLEELQREQEEACTRAVSATKIQALYRDFQIRKALKLEAEKKQFVDLVIAAARSKLSGNLVERSVLMRGDAWLVRFLAEDPSEELRVLILRGRVEIQIALRKMQELVRTREREAAAIKLQVAFQGKLARDTCRKLRAIRDRELLEMMASFEARLAGKEIANWSHQEHLMDMLSKRVKSQNAYVKETRDEGQLTSCAVSGMLGRLEFFRRADLDELASQVLNAHISSLKRLRNALPEEPELAPKLRSPETNLDVLDLEGLSELHRAVERGELREVLALLEDGASVDVLTLSGATPLHLAAAYGCADIADELIAAGADVNATEHENLLTPLYWAVSIGDLGIVRALITAGATVDVKAKDGSTLLHKAAENGPVELMTFLICAGAQIDARDLQGNLPLHTAAQSGNAFVVGFLSDRASEMINAKNYVGETSLHVAAESGHTQVVIMLVGSGAHVNAKDSSGATPLKKAAYAGNVDAVKILCNLQSAVEVVQRVFNAAVKEGNVRAVWSLIAAGADANVRDSDGDTLLHWAAENGHASVTVALIDAGALVDIENGLELTPLLLAVKNRHARIVGLLVGAKANVNATDGFHRTLLRLAVDSRQANIVRVLIDAGADVHGQYEQGKTLLHIATEEWNGDLIDALIIGALVGAGANVLAEDDEGQTPNKYAIDSANNMLEELNLSASKKKEGGEARAVNTE